NRPAPVATAHDGRGSPVELHHTLWIQQDVRILGGLPLQPEALSHARARVGGQTAHARVACREDAHRFTPNRNAMASFICQRMSSLNCTIPSALSCSARVRNRSSVTARENSTSRRARLTRLRK